MSQFETIENLKHLNKKLETEKEAALQRAARRYKDMMHANRRAERAERALEKEAWERRDDQIKATTLFRIYKETITALELAATQAQRSGPSEEQFQAMRATNARLEAAIVEQREDSVRLQTSAEETVRGLHVQFDAYKSQIKNEAAQHYEGRLAETKQQLSEEFSRKAQAGIMQIHKVHQACKAENESLKQKLKQATQMLEWQRKHTNQHTAEPVALQGQPRGAGIYAGFPLPPQQSPISVKETANKRRKLDSMGNAGIITPDRQSSRRNSTKPNASVSTPKMKAQNAFREQEETPQQWMTPSHLNMTPRQQKRPEPHTSPSQQSHGQPQTLPPHLQGIPQAEKLFSGFLQQLNLQRLSIGQTELGPQEALPLFNQWVAQKLGRQVLASSSDNIASRPVLQHSESSPLAFSQRESSSTGLQFPFLSTNTPLGPQTPTPPNMVPPSPGYSVDVARMQQVHQRDWQQQQGQLYGKLPSPDVAGQNLDNSLPILPTHYNTTSPLTLHNDEIHAQSNQLQASPYPKDLYRESQPAFQPENVDMYRSPEDSEPVQEMGGIGMLAETPNGDSPAVEGGNVSFEMDNTQLPFSSSDAQNLGSGFSLEEIRTTRGAAMQSLPSMQINHSDPNGYRNQQSHVAQLQQHPQFHAIDPALLSNPADSFNTPSSSHDHFPPLQRSMNQTTAPFDHSLHQAPLLHQPMSQKRSIPPPSSRSTPATSTRSTPAPAGPCPVVCLHCHENWWNDSCDAGEPCQNCVGSGTACQRPQCLNFAMGTCNKAQCQRVHEGDMRYRNVVAKPKTLKRIGKKGEQRPSPRMLTFQQG
ncbi:hypothetical protein EKO04_009061 [Ascochyta lentis]|uniref:C3H1-type domain-containing protein n=1 Tax=Ascochyta lentis TaxID=205686 RepID=A0A8H7MGT3_9PLEO|nr:hypothetical protein EKO04_009061 [Ascochyta lentis]